MTDWELTQDVPPDWQREVHVWALRQPDADADADADSDVLSAADRAAASAFLDEGARRRFAWRRACLRRLLARYLGVEATAIVMRGEKPAIVEPATRLVFSASSARGWLLVAVTETRALGVDVEERDLDPAGLETLAARVLAPPELTRWRALDAGRRAGALLRGWTRKEAAAKAVGRGLALAFPALDVSDDTIDVEARRLRLVDFTLPDGALGALAVEEPAPRLRWLDGSAALSRR